MRVVEYEIELLEPVLAGRLDEDENTASSLDYLPGSMLRGAIIGKYMRERGHKKIDAGEPEKRRLFFDGTTRYLNAYPLVLERRSLPVPFSWYRVKDEEDTAYDFSLSKNIEKKQWVKIPFPFCVFPNDMDDDKAYLIRPEQRLSIHIARNRRKGTAYKKTGTLPGENMDALFRYRSLAEGQHFKGVIICGADEDVELFKELMQGEMFIGKSSRAGYGRIGFSNVRCCRSPDWREVPMQLESEGNKICFTLASDALIRDDQGQFSLSPIDLIKTIEEQLGVSLELEASYLREQLIGGFNRKWGLPLPQAQAFAMGSVFVCNKPDCDFQKLKNKLEKLEVTGIGMRRIDGYGRVLVNWLGKGEFKVEEQSPTEPDPVFLKEGTYAHDLAKQMLNRMAQKKLDRGIIGKANKVRIKSASTNNNQLSRLRLVIREILYSASEEQGPDLSKIGDFIDKECERKTAGKFYEITWLDGENLSNWINSHLKKVDSVSWCNLFDDMLQKKSIGNVEIEYPKPMRKEYLLKYVDAVIAKIMREVDKNV
jgi:CRISPR-associated protein Csx10